MKQAKYALESKSLHLTQRSRPELIPLKRALGAQIEALRVHLGVPEQPLSTARLGARIASRLGYQTPISPSTILRWERGEGTIEPWELIALAEEAGKSVEEFVYPIADEAQRAATRAAVSGEMAREARPAPRKRAPADDVGSG